MNEIVKSVDNIIQGDIEKYYEFRRYKEPTDIEAFLWLITEIAEIAELLPEFKSDDIEYVLSQMIDVGSIAEIALKRTAGWVRNNPTERPKTPEDLKGEIADVLMMLYKFAEKSGVSPFMALVEKMESKGWTGEASMSSYKGGKGDG